MDEPFGGLTKQEFLKFLEDGADILDNHQKKLAAMIESGELQIPPGTMVDVDVRHDPKCGLWSGRPCDCDPEIVPWKKPDA